LNRCYMEHPNKIRELVNKIAQKPALRRNGF
jgi:hypothetical protein